MRVTIRVFFFLWLERSLPRIVVVIDNGSDNDGDDEARHEDISHTRDTIAHATATVINIQKTPMSRAIVVAADILSKRDAESRP